MVLVDLPREVKTLANFIANSWVTPKSATYLDVTSPYSGAVIARVPVSGRDVVDEAVAAAHTAFATWRHTPIKERSQILFNYRALVLKNIDHLANLAAVESGKTRDEGRAGIMKGIEVCEFALSLQNMDSGAAMDVSRGVTCEYRREALGVVVGIAPFNFPAMVPMWMYPIAITLGNAFVLKPSEKVPMTMSAMADLMAEAGFPKGIFSIVHGDKSTVEALIDHPHTKAVAFVGSTPAAKAVYTRATALGKRALTLGGAKNHLIVAPDADAEMTVRGILDSFTGCAGQRCMAASLMLAIDDPRTDAIIASLVEKTKALPIGTGMGAIIDKAALTRIENAIDQAAKSGAKILFDGRRPHAPKEYAKGFWLGPTIIDHAKPDMDCAKKEIFGPVITIIRVKSLAEAMEMENKNPFGNATSVFTTSGAVAKYVADRASNGMIGVNIGVPVPREPFSFGGTKESKFGHGDITGRSVLDFWSDMKKITMKWSMQKDANWMS